MSNELPSNAIPSDVRFMTAGEMLEMWGDAVLIPVLIVQETVLAPTEKPAAKRVSHQAGVSALRAVAGADTEAILKLVDSEGWRVTASGSHSYAISATQTVVGIYRSLGPEVLGRALRLLGAIYEGDPGCVRKYILRGVAEGLARIPETEDVAIAERIKAAYPTVSSLHDDGGNFYAVIRDRVIRLARAQ